MVETLKEFLAKRIELLKMEATEKTVIILAFFVFSGLFILMFLVFVILLNIGLGLILGHYIGNYGYGILLIAGFYLIFVFITLLFKNSIKKRVANFFLKFINS
ncbi:hypothetical protein SAMN05421847_3010 [Halpernia humi]|uniref:Holin-X, holin superfamily III n=1 Tax=Halpernia humi TaxID=493375 RepID=A0A1H6BMU7_9FLAO|nr:hypothetical protein [Halpernia humi]SEG61990.1 hypothetical protein SAMN05421847_3010 [Halpernia humi]